MVLPWIYGCVISVYKNSTEIYDQLRFHRAPRNCALVATYASVTPS
jgi:hypothetical protein